MTVSVPLTFRPGGGAVIGHFRRVWRKVPSNCRLGGLGCSEDGGIQEAGGLLLKGAARMVGNICFQ